MNVAEVCRSHERIGLDTNLFIYLFEGSGNEAASVGQLLDAFSANESRGVLATLAIAEIMTGPLRGRDGALAERYRDELASLEGVDLVPLTVEIAADAAALRAGARVHLADAIHLATARVAGATAFVTNDRSLRSTQRLEVIQLAE